jgi:mannose-6-phosphate isomerase-like protein (cupin superfamily)
MSPILDEEAILRSETRDISILVARDDLTITCARYAAGQSAAGPHVHNRHTDAFYVLEGRLTFEIGRERELITVSPGGFVTVPPGVAHAFGVAGNRPARWLTIHAPDGGFARFMRGVRDGIDVEWDIAPAPVAGGLPARAAIIKQPPAHRSSRSGPPGNGLVKRQPLDPGASAAIAPRRPEVGATAIRWLCGNPEWVSADPWS